MGKETKIERIIEELREFNDDPQQSVRYITLNKAEVINAERYLYECDLSIKITSQKEVRKGKFDVRFEKKQSEREDL